MNRFFQSRGHTIKILLKQANVHRIESHYVYDNVDVFPPDQYTEISLFQWADAVLTHLDYSAWSQQLAGMFGKPVFQIIHNDYPRDHIISADRPQFIVYNSNWIKDKLAYPHDSFVLHPPTDYRHYKVDMDAWDNEHITLINLDQNKGGEILREIAKALPVRKFLGVMGSYSEPIKIGQITDQPSNVQIMPKQQDIREAYKLTRILIMPSKYESWGRTATEAMASGIPVIASPTEGLKENCGNAGIFVKDRDDVSEWVKEIQKLDDEKRYRRASAKASVRAIELNPTHELTQMSEWMEGIINDYRSGNGSKYNHIKQGN
jgi:glycosyltransferase involved in cell wall biosynthesis